MLCLAIYLLEDLLIRLRKIDLLVFQLFEPQVYAVDVVLQSFYTVYSSETFGDILKRKLFVRIFSELFAELINHLHQGGHLVSAHSGVPTVAFVRDCRGLATAYAYLEHLELIFELFNSVFVA